MLKPAVLEEPPGLNANTILNTPPERVQIVWMAKDICSEAESYKFCEGTIDNEVHLYTRKLH